MALLSMGLSSSLWIGPIFGGAYTWRGLCTEGNLQNRLGYLVVGRKFTIFALFYFVFEGKFQVQATRGLIFGGAI